MDAVILGIAGAALFAIGIRSFVRSLPVRAAVDLEGVVVEVEKRRTSRSTSRSKVYRPTIEYQHPAMRSVARYTPEASTGETFDVGDRVKLAYDPASDSVVIRSFRRRTDDFGIALVGLVMIGFAVLAALQ
jgi:Protein of unknown function (DUF3592)